MITMTERAAEQVKRIATEEDNAGKMLRVGVLPGGCSGFSWDLRFDDQTTEHDEVLEFFGVQVVCDKRTYKLIGGTEIDYAPGIEAAGFKFGNPKSKSSCGCGTSFEV